jgi:ATP-dependent Clp protease, protease subunit
MNTLFNIIGNIDRAKAKDAVRAPVTVVVTGAFNEELVGKVREQVNKALETGQEVLPVVVDSFGGEVYSLLAIIDILRAQPLPIVTIVQGKAMSCGAVLFSLGHRRYAAPQSTILIHEVSNHLWGKNVDLKNDVAEVERLNERIFTILDVASGQVPGYWKKRVHENGHADIYLTPEQALEVGLATTIGVPNWVVSVAAKMEVR